MNNSFIIYHLDDENDTFEVVESYIPSLKEEIGQDIKYISVTKKKDLMDVIKNQNIPINLIILDMYDENKSKNISILDIVKNTKREIPVIIYTVGSNRDNRIDYCELRRKYSFIFEKEIIKYDNAEELISQIKKLIYKKLFPANRFNNVLYQLYDNDDLELQMQIYSVGQKNFDEIIFKLRKQKSINDKILIYRLASGFSGAVVFRLEYGSNSHILKISRDKDKLMQEIELAHDLYLNFPAQLRIDIAGNNMEFETDETKACLIENVRFGKTISSWLKEIKSAREVESFFNDLYFSPNSLQFHYSNKQSEKVKFVEIFEKLKNQKYTILQNYINDFLPIINRDFPNISTDNLLKFIKNTCYEAIDVNELLGEQWQKPLVLCHGDFHANNIMIQGVRPVLIDTGEIQYNYWCIDICRLLVYMFIWEFDKGTYDYFDLNSVANNLDKMKKIIDLKQLDVEERNIGFIYAINWLTQNIGKIYGDLYSKWEFQLGLCKELLQAIYRTTSLPTSKRVLALVAAYESLISANVELNRFKNEKV